MRQIQRIGLREVRALKPNATVYDKTLPGFCARRQHSTEVVFWFRYRAAGRERWFKIGRYGAPWTAAAARAEALRLYKCVARGEDPAAAKAAARAPFTVGDLLDQYWADAVSGRLLKRNGRAKKASTLESDVGRINGHIKPLLGHLPLTSLRRQDVEEFMHAVAEGKTAKRRGGSSIRGGKGAATRTLILLNAILNYAIDRELIAVNVAKKVTPFAGEARSRRLSDQEYKLLAEALQVAASKTFWPSALAAIRFLALTGWRSGEALALHWYDVDQAKRVAVLPDTKSGRSVRVLSRRALELIAEQPRVPGADLVFPGTLRGKSFTGLSETWALAVTRFGMPKDITPHTLRHSFASLAADLGYSESTIAALLGHKGQSVTAGYIHRGDKVLLAAADEIAERTAELMDGVAKQSEVISLYRA